MVSGSIPAAPPKLTNHPAVSDGFFNFDAVDRNRIRGTRGERGTRAACGEPVNDVALASATAGQDGRFPQPPPIEENVTFVVTFFY